MRGIFGPERDKVTGKWRRLHDEELNDLYYSQNIIWVTKDVGGAYGQRGGVYRMLVGLMVCMGRGKVYIGCWWGLCYVWAEERCM